MVGSRLWQVLAFVFLASATARGQTLEVNFTGLTAFLPPDVPTNPLLVGVVKVSSGGSFHRAYLQWDTSVTTISNTNGWTCHDNTNGWKYCEMGSPPTPENFEFHFASTDTTTTGAHFSCIVPIEDVLKKPFTPNGTGFVSYVTLPHGMVDSTYNDPSYWEYNNNAICLPPSEVATLTSNADLAQAVEFWSTNPSRSHLQLKRAPGNPDRIVVWINNIRPAELENLPSHTPHSHQTTDPDFQLYQVIVPNFGGNHLDIPQAIGSCGNPICSYRGYTDMRHPDGSNCPPVRFKKGTYRVTKKGHRKPA